MKKQQLIFFSLCALLAGCAPTVANRGSILEEESLAQIKPGLTTREQVAVTLGTPTAISTVDDKVWYYMGRQTQQYSFFTPDVIKQKVVEVDFDDKGVVTKVANLDLPEATDATPVDRATPTYGQHNTILREILGNLGRPRPAIKQRGSGT